MEQARVFDGDAGFTGEHAEQLEMTLIKCALVIGKYGHGANGMVVGHQGDAAKTASSAKRLYTKLLDLGDIVFADQNGLARSNEVLREMVSGGTRASGHAIATDDFQLKAKFVAERVQFGDVNILDVEEPAQFFPDLLAKLFFLQCGTENTADFVEHVQLFGAPRSLLDQITVLDGHADLVA